VTSQKGKNVFFVRVSLVISNPFWLVFIVTYADTMIFYL